MMGAVSRVSCSRLLVVTSVSITAGLPKVQKSTEAAQPHSCGSIWNQDAVRVQPSYCFNKEEMTDFMRQY